MISLDDAQTRLLALGGVLPCETVPIAEAMGRWGAADVVALRTQPARDLSAMDGYAVAYDGHRTAWRVIGESAAGSPFRGEPKPGEAVRIFTGSALPDGTDTVIIQEDVQRDDSDIAIDQALTVARGQHVRAAGSDFAAGDCLIRTGERISPGRLALAASGGHGSLTVHARVRVAIISTGDELVPPGVEAGDDKLPSSNALMIAALIRDLPCIVTDLGIIPDSLTALTAAIAGAEADIIVTTGGASVGDHDLVRPALIAAGATIDFWKIAMRPGKPLMAGQLRNSVCLGLPGNPVSAFATAHLFLRPLIAAMSGSQSPLPPRSVASLGVALPATGPRTDHVRATVAGETVFPVGPNDSAALLGLANATALIIRPAQSPPASIGDKIEYISIA
ncbi:MAG: gephyrin-like molybdotransferase Glp [Sphingomonadaceae bacterium]